MYVLKEKKKLKFIVHKFLYLMQYKVKFYFIYIKFYSNYSLMNSLIFMYKEKIK